MVRGSSGINGSSDGENTSVGNNSNDVGSSGTNDEAISFGHHHSHSHYNGGRKYTPSNAQVSHGVEDSSFDFYVYSMSYQPEFCRENNEKFVGCHDPNKFWEGQMTIHGLWPNREDGSWPSTCSQEKLDDSLLQNLSDTMSKEWPNIKATKDSPAYDSFWSHEWVKHGTCSGLSQEDYFSTALKLLLPTPSVVKEKYGDIVERTELEKGFGGDGADDTNTVLVCKSGYLSEVRVCFGKVDGGAVGERRPCPGTVLKEDSCGDDIKIASFDTRVATTVE